MSNRFGSWLGYLLALICLSALAWLGNELSISFFFGVDFIFGSVAVILAVLLLDLPAAVVVALVGGAITWQMWGHPYAMIVFTCEGLFVGRLYRRGFGNVVIGDTVFWCLLGGPMVLVFYHFQLGLPMQSTVLILLKQSINGIANSVLAYSLWMLGVIWIGSWQRGYRQRVAYRDLLFVIFLSMLFFPMLAGVMWFGREKFYQVTGNRAAQLDSVVQQMQKTVDLWMDEKLRHVQALASQSPLQDAKTLGTLQSLTRILARSDTDFHNMYVADADAVTLAFEPMVNEKGQSTIGLRFSDRSYYKQLRAGRAYVVSQVFHGRGGVFKPIVTISVPIQRQGQFDGYALGALNLQVLSDRLSQLVDHNRMQMRLLDDTGRLVASTVKGDKLLSPFDPAQHWQLAPLSGAVQWGFRRKDRDKPVMSRWANAAMVLQGSASPQYRWRVILSMLAQSSMQVLFTFYNRALLLIYLMALLAMVVAAWLSRMMVRSMSGLNRIAVRLPDQLEGLSAEAWPESMIDEFAGLSDSFRRMHHRLVDLFQSLRESRDLLESRVAERTEALSQSNQELEQEIQKRAQLQVTLELRDRAIEAAMEGIVIAEVKDGQKVIFVNTGFEKLTGYSRDEIIGTNCRVLQGPKTDCHSREQLRDAIVQGESISLEILNYRKGGQPFWNFLSLSPIFHRDGSLEYYVGVIQDVTERRESEQRIRAIVDTVLDGIITINDQGDVLTFNPGAERLFGMSAEQVIGRNIKTLMPKQYSENHDKYLRHYFETGKRHVIGQTREVQGRRADGSCFPLELSVTEVELDNRRMFTGILRDITARKESEAAMRQARDAAESANRAKTVFLSFMSHEIRTPLNHIVNMARFLQSATLPPEQQEYAGILVRSSELLLTLLNDLLDLSKIESGRLDIEWIRFDLHQVLESCTQIVASRCRDKGLEFEQQVDPAVACSWVGDPTRLKQILLNLLSNAIKFTDEGGIALQVTGTMIEPDRWQLHFAVSDTGVGIPDDRKQDIFNRFEQVDSSTTRQYGGTGLGLAICRELAEAMGGHVSVKDRPGGGSVFELVLTLAPAPASSRTEIDHPGQVQNWDPDRQWRLLVVDDDTTNLLVVRELLKPVPCEIDTAANGREAVRLFSGKAYDLVLMDLHMPVMDGYQATEQIRMLETEQERAPVPVIALTAMTLDQQFDQTEWSGMTDRLVKPLNQSDLLAKLRFYLPTTLTPSPAGQSTVVLPAVPGLNPTRGLERCGDSLALYRQVLNQLIDAGPGVVQAVWQSEVSSDQRVAILHRLRSTMGLAGADALGRTAEQIESQLREGLAVDRALFKELSDRMTEVLDSARQLLEQMHLPEEAPASSAESPVAVTAAISELRSRLSENSLSLEPELGIVIHQVRRFIDPAMADQLKSAVDGLAFGDAIVLLDQCRKLISDQRKTDTDHDR